MESVDILFRRNIITLRQLCGFSVSKMAKLSGISYKTLKSIENGGYAGNITLKQLKKIHRNFGIPPCFMVDEYPERLEEIYILHSHGTETRLQYLLGKNVSDYQI